MQRLKGQTLGTRTLQRVHEPRVSSFLLAGASPFGFTLPRGDALILSAFRACIAVTRPTGLTVSTLSSYQMKLYEQPSDAKCGDFNGGGGAMAGVGLADLVALLAGALTFSLSLSVAHFR